MICKFFFLAIEKVRVDKKESKKKKEEDEE